MSGIFLKNKKEVNCQNFLILKMSSSLPDWLSSANKSSDNLMSDTSTVELENKLKNIFEDAEEQVGVLGKKKKKVNVKDNKRKIKKRKSKKSKKSKRRNLEKVEK